MGIKEYKFKKENIDHIDEILEKANTSYKNLESFTENCLDYSSELFEIYGRYIQDCNVHMLSFLDFIKNTYDRIDVVKDIFKKDEGLYQKITITLSRLENVFETYEYMCSKIEELKEEYLEELVNYRLRNVLSNYDEDDMKEKWQYICPFHFELIERMNDFAIGTAQPQLDIADAIYAVEMDFNKAMNLKPLNDEKIK